MNVRWGRSDDSGPGSTDSGGVGGMDCGPVGRVSGPSPPPPLSGHPDLPLTYQLNPRWVNPRSTDIDVSLRTTVGWVDMIVSSKYKCPRNDTERSEVEEFGTRIGD